jgi:hypothetical protein
MEIIETGALRRVDAERTEDVTAVQLFQGIYGVGMWSQLPLLSTFFIRPPGPSIAHTWYLAGCRTLEDIRQRKGGITLSQVQAIGLKYYDGALPHPIRWIVLIVVKQISIRECHEKKPVRYSGQSNPSVSLPIGQHVEALRK